MDLISASSRLEALGNPTRLAVFRLLVRAGEAGLAVGQIQERLSVPSSTLSHHIKSLMIVQLIEQERVGKTLICRANYAEMNGLIGFLVAECCADATCTTTEDAA
ncbi:helix-turn-helix transcriptional regulator [Paracoccus sp. SY]|uniref:ArsR/SmtB family transcription factor n=1 Tax=Paracoccus sp. SY TaxID=1330255 RepID=UPI000CD12233|nr:metalloregulator ArsR/SmtB family transcription factor [Paracoccus sp. SY]